MPHGDSSGWAFDTFKGKAVAAGGVISDDLLAEFKEELNEAIRRENDDIELSGEARDYV